MLDKYLKIFGLDNNFSLEELEGKYKKLLKEFDTKNIEDDLKIIFLEEQVKIQEAYQILLKYYHKIEKVEQVKSGNIPSSPKARNKNNKERNIIISICVLLVLVIGSFFAYNSFSDSETSPPKKEDSCVLIFKENGFYNSENNMRTNGKKIFECFQEKGVKVDSIHYQMISDYGIEEKINNQNYNLITDLIILDNLIQKFKDAPNSDEIVEAIEKIRNYNNLINGGLKGRNFTWIWLDGKLVYGRNIRPDKEGYRKIDNGFLESFRNNIITFLTEIKPIPTSLLSDIENYLDTIDGSKNIIKGCTDSDFQEFNRRATEDDGSCKKKHVLGCLDNTYKEFKKKYTKDTKPTSCKTKKTVKGCMQKVYKEFNPKAKSDTKPTSCKTLKKEKLEKEKKKSTLENLMLGCWSLEYQWNDCTGDWSNTEKCYLSNGDLHTYGGPINATWKVNGNNYSHTVENGTKYTGVYRNGVITGTIIGGVDGDKGCFKMRINNR